MSKTNIWQCAQSEWPEDEAYSVICTYKRRKENDWDANELQEGLNKDISHMHKVFSSEVDSADLITRFDRYIKENLIK